MKFTCIAVYCAGYSLQISISELWADLTRCRIICYSSCSEPWTVEAATSDLKTQCFCHWIPLRQSASSADFLLLQTLRQSKSLQSVVYYCRVKRCAMLNKPQMISMLNFDDISAASEHSSSSSYCDNPSLNRHRRDSLVDHGAVYVDVRVRIVWLYRLLSCLSLHCGESCAVGVGCQLLRSINDVTRVSWYLSFANSTHRHFNDHFSSEPRFTTWFFFLFRLFANLCKFCTSRCYRLDFLYPVWQTMSHFNIGTSLCQILSMFVVSVVYSTRSTLRISVSNDGCTCTVFQLCLYLVNFN